MKNVSYRVFNHKTAKAVTPNIGVENRVSAFLVARKLNEKFGGSNYYVVRYYQDKENNWHTEVMS